MDTNNDHELHTMLAAQHDTDTDRNAYEKYILQYGSNALHTEYMMMFAKTLHPEILSKPQLIKWSPTYHHIPSPSNFIARLYNVEIVNLSDIKITEISDIYKNMIVIYHVKNNRVSKRYDELYTLPYPIVSWDRLRQCYPMTIKYTDRNNDTYIYEPMGNKRGPVLITKSKL